MQFLKAFLLSLCLAFLAAPAQSQVFLEVGGACAQDHGDGIWYQKAFAPQVDLCSPTWAMGYRMGAWSVGGTHLFSVTSHSQATVRDQDYDPQASRCLNNCNTLATFDTEGSVNGAFLRYEWSWSSGAVVELGGLVFRPQQTVWVSNHRHNGDAANTPVSARYDNQREWNLTPSIGLGWKKGPVRVMARFYPWVKTGGDELSADKSTFVGLTGLYNGPTATFSLSYDISQ